MIRDGWETDMSFNIAGPEQVQENCLAVLDLNQLPRPLLRTILASKLSMNAEHVRMFLIATVVQRILHHQQGAAGRKVHMWQT